MGMSPTELRRATKVAPYNSVVVVFQVLDVSLILFFLELPASLVAIFERQASGAVRAGREQGQQPLEVLTLARRTGRRAGVLWPDQRFKNIAAAAAFVFVEGHDLVVGR